MLGAISDYINAWLFLVMGVFIVVWIVGGGYLIRRSFRQYDRRRNLGRDMLASFLAGISGAFAAGATILAVTRMSNNPAIVVAGTVFALAAALGVAIIVLYAMFGLSAKQTLSASVIPLGAVTAMGLLLGAGYLVPTRMEVLRQGRRTSSCQQLVTKIFPAYVAYINTYRKPPENLRVLVAQKLLEPKDLKSPLNPSREIGYFYFPAIPERRRKGKTIEQVLACDFRDNTDGSGRAVLLIQEGRCQWYSEANFQKLLQRKENAAFAKALRAAEGK